MGRKARQPNFPLKRVLTWRECSKKGDQKKWLKGPERQPKRRGRHGGRRNSKAGCTNEALLKSGKKEGGKQKPFARVVSKEGERVRRRPAGRETQGGGSPRGVPFLGHSGKGGV